MKKPGRRLARANHRVASRRADQAVDLADSNRDVDPLTPAQVRDLRRRLADARDPTRYLLVSEFTPRFKLYYNVSDDMYVMNEPDRGTMFKRRQGALAVMPLLGRGVTLVQCTTRVRKGRRVVVKTSMRRVQRRRGR